MTRKRRFFFLAAGIVLLSALLYRLAGTVEARLCFGSPEERLDLCRTVPDLSGWRREHALLRLLGDTEASVRLGALTAVGRVEMSGTVARRVEAMVFDQAEEPQVRERAGVVLLGTPEPPEMLQAYLRTQASEPSFRSRFPLLVAAWAGYRLPATSLAVTATVCCPSVKGAAGVPVRMPFS